MPIAQFKPTVPTTSVPAPTQALPPKYQANLYDNKKLNLQGLIAYVSGMPWTTEAYYRQLVGPHNDLKEIDPGLDPVYQSYEKINGLEIRVAGALAASVNSDTQDTLVTGSGMIYPPLVPNRNDYFTSKTSIGQLALFRVAQQPRRLTFQDQSVYEIEYQMVGYLDAGDELLKDLERKSSDRQLVFSKARLVEGLSPMLTLATFETLAEMQEEYSRLLRDYTRTFFNLRCYTLVVPGQTELVYDPFLVDFLLTTTEVAATPELMRIKHLETENDPYFQQPQFWKMLYERESERKQEYAAVMGTAGVTSFHVRTTIRSLFQGVVQKVLYPMVPDMSMVSGREIAARPATEITWEPTTNFQGGQLSEEDNQLTVAGVVKLLYPTDVPTDAYVLTTAFWAETAEQSILEILVNDYLFLRTIDTGYLRQLVKLYPKLNRLQQFYWGPLLLILLQEAQRTAY